MKATITIDGYEPQEVKFKESISKSNPTGFVVWHESIKPDGRVMLKLVDGGCGHVNLYVVNVEGEMISGGALFSFYNDGTAQHNIGVCLSIPIARDSKDRILLMV